MAGKACRIIFMGTPDFAVPSLKGLFDAGYDISAVVTRPDMPRGRGRVMSMPPVKEIAIKLGIMVFQPENIHEELFITAIRDLKPDMITVVAYGKILPEAILNIPPMGCINLHASLLPRYRGAAPINWAIINGESETGVTTMLMDRGMDTGDILMSEIVPITQDDTAGTVHDRLKEKGARLLVKSVDRLVDGTISPLPQDNSQATYAPMLRKEDSHIDWKKGALRIKNLVRGLSPVPGAYTRWGDTTLKILSGFVKGEDTQGVPGTICNVTKDGIEVITGNGIYVIEVLKPASRRMMKVDEFIRGYDIVQGQILN